LVNWFRNRARKWDLEILLIAVGEPSNLLVFHHWPAGRDVLLAFA